MARCVESLLSLAAVLAFCAADAAPASVVPPVYQTLPADCSAATVPGKPVEVSINGAAFAPAGIKIIPDKDYTTIVFSNDVENPDRTRAQITVPVKEGGRLDAATFRLRPGAVDAPVGESLLWSLRDRNHDLLVDYSDTHAASLLLQFGQRRGNSISGTVYLCVPKGARDELKKDSYVIGSFQAEFGHW